MSNNAVPREMEEPHEAGLLAAAHAALMAHVVPALEGSAKFQALMVANAIAIAQRGLGSGVIAPLPDETALCAAIRAGAHDDDAALAVLLHEHTETRCRISSKPPR
jgi:hypothetical protein